MKRLDREVKPFGKQFRVVRAKTVRVAVVVFFANVQGFRWHQSAQPRRESRAQVEAIFGEGSVPAQDASVRDSSFFLDNFWDFVEICEGAVLDGVDLFSVGAVRCDLFALATVEITEAAVELFERKGNDDSIFDDDHLNKIDIIDILEFNLEYFCFRIKTLLFLTSGDSFFYASLFCFLSLNNVPLNK